MLSSHLTGEIDEKKLGFSKLKQRNALLVIPYHSNIYSVLKNKFKFCHWTKLIDYRGCVVCYRYDYTPNIWCWVLFLHVIYLVFSLLFSYEVIKVKQLIFLARRHVLYSRYVLILVISYFIGKWISCHTIANWI